MTWHFSDTSVAYVQQQDKAGYSASVQLIDMHILSHSSHTE